MVLRIINCSYMAFFFYNSGVWTSLYAPQQILWDLFHCPLAGAPIKAKYGPAPKEYLIPKEETNLQVTGPDNQVNPLRSFFLLSKKILIYAILGERGGWALNPCQMKSPLRVLSHTLDAGQAQEGALVFYPIEHDQELQSLTRSYRSGDWGFRLYFH